MAKNRNFGIFNFNFFKLNIDQSYDEIRFQRTKIHWKMLHLFKSQKSVKLC